jgi:hypothetical protein
MQPFDSDDVRGLALRYYLYTLLLEAPGPVSVQQLLRLLAREHLIIRGRPSKVISDALRWEIGKGRVRRVSHATYVASRSIPRGTAHRIRCSVAAWREEAAAAALHRPPAPVPAPPPPRFTRPRARLVTRF